MRALLMITASTCVACSQADGDTDSSQPATTAEVTKALDEQRKTLAENSQTGEAGTAYAFSFDGLLHDRIDLSAFQGRPILVVNTASECGFTPQYADLQATYDRYKEQGLIVIGVPSNDFGGQEPGSAKEIEKFCRLNYGVTFAMAEKSVVRGPDAHPFYRWAEEKLGAAAVPKWNFHKLLIGTDGLPVAAFPSSVSPTSDRLTSAVEAALVN